MGAFQVLGSSGGVAPPMDGGNLFGSLAALGQMTQEAQIERLTKLVHILWKEVEKLEHVVQVFPEGVRVKAGISEILVLKNGGIIVSGARVLLKSFGKEQIFLY